MVMPRKNSNDELNEWNRKLDIAREARGKRIKIWEYWERIYNDQLWGKYSTLDKEGKEIKRYSQLNELETIVLNILPGIIFYDPIFELTPTHSAWSWSAAVWELVASYLYNLLSLDEAVEEMAMDGLILGSGIHKTGNAAEVADTSYQLGDASTGEPEIRRDMIFSSWVSPMEMLIDYGVNKWKDLRWIAQEVRKPLDEVKRDKTYNNTANLVGTESSSDDVLGVQASRQRQHKELKNDTVLLFEIHDLEHGKIITIADKHNKFIRKDDDYGIPLYDLLNFQPSRPRQVWGKSITQSIEGHIVDVSKDLSYMHNHARRAGLTKMMVDKVRVDREAQEGLKSSEDFKLIAVENLAMGAPIEELKASAVSFDFYQNLNLEQSMMRGLSGVSMQERGRHEPGVETAFEASQLAEGSNRRNLHRGKKLNRFISGIMEKMLTIVSDTWPRQRILDSVGIPQEASHLLLPFTNIRLDIKFGSTAMQAREEELRKVTMLASLLGQAGIQVNPEGFVKLVANALGLDFSQQQMLLQSAPMQQGQQSGQGTQGGAQGGTQGQMMGQLQSSLRGG